MLSRHFQYRRMRIAALQARRCPPREKREQGQACLQAIRAFIEGVARGRTRPGER
jgi:hypothetical protein